MVRIKYKTGYKRKNKFLKQPKLQKFQQRRGLKLEKLPCYRTTRHQNDIKISGLN